jgi:hypothetical protein
VPRWDKVPQILCARLQIDAEREKSASATKLPKKSLIRTFDTKTAGGDAMTSAQRLIDDGATVDTSKVGIRTCRSRIDNCQLAIAEH